ncbi:TlpA family protein disulfide reductase [Thermomonospora umbrina]|uniref:AhpC/TSA family protein n=1 Tax=Thermomonospora umbrina TaxID=111806 RepID=A0A3D9SML9_9ACTN|nr:MauE/DoxX family redox-associated membrane protein [Thermomonospora umbrina]REE97176.1 AhpC/TSA family protein [Thermomonospora umbrina]
MNMGTILAFAVGLTLALAAVTKVREPGAFVRGVGEYRVLPGSLVPVVAWGVVIAEALAAAALLSGLGRPAGAVAGTVLGAAFAAAIGVNLRRRRRMRCHCFGASEPLTSRSLTRALLLAVASAAVLLPWPPADPPWSAETAVSAVAGLVAMLVTGRLLAFRPPSPEPAPAAPPGDVAPRVTAPLVGSAEPFDSATVRGPLLVVFTAIGCKVCATALPDLFEEATRERAAIVVVCVGPPNACADLARTMGREDVTVVHDPKGAVLASFRINRIPSAVLVAENGTVARHIAFTPPILEERR